MILEQGEKRARGAGGAGEAGEAGGDENSCKEEAVENSSYPLVPIPNSQFPIPHSPFPTPHSQFPIPHSPSLKLHKLNLPRVK